MRTIKSLLSIPAAILSFILGNLLFYIAGIVYNGISSYNDGIHSFGVADAVMTYLLIYVAQSIIPVVMANFAMLFLLEGENRWWLSTFPKILFATFGALFFIAAIVFRFVTGIEFMQYVASYILTVASFIVTPIVLSSKSS